MPVSSTTKPVDKERVSVPILLTADISAPGGLPPAPSPAQKSPAWPDVNVVRAHLFSGDRADIELMSPDQPKSEYYRVRVICRGDRTTLVVENWVPAIGGSRAAYTPIGTLCSETNEFMMPRTSTLPLDKFKVTLFATWFSDLLVGLATPGVEVSCFASHRAARSAAKAARIASERLSSRIASVAAFAKAAEGERAPTWQAVRAIHTCLRHVQALDKDEARLKNDVGFSKS